jgi:hypothetical protein
LILQNLDVLECNVNWNEKVTLINSIKVYEIT